MTNCLARSHNSDSEALGNRFCLRKRAIHCSICQRRRSGNRLNLCTKIPATAGPDACHSKGYRAPAGRSRRSTWKSGLSLVLRGSRRFVRLVAASPRTEARALLSAAGRTDQAYGRHGRFEARRPGRRPRPLSMTYPASSLLGGQLIGKGWLCLPRPQPTPASRTPGLPGPANLPVALGPPPGSALVRASPSAPHTQGSTSLGKYPLQAAGCPAKQKCSCLLSLFIVFTFPACHDST